MVSIPLKLETQNGRKAASAATSAGVASVRCRFCGVRLGFHNESGSRVFYGGVDGLEVVADGSSCYHCFARSKSGCDAQMSLPVPADAFAPAQRIGAVGAQRPGLVLSSINKQNAEQGVCLEVYKQDVRIVRKLKNSQRRGQMVETVQQRAFRLGVSGGAGIGTRKAITKLTKAALRRMVWAARNIVGLTHMITLTYPGKRELCPTDGKVVKYHWQRMRQWMQREGVGGGFWFLEFQVRGVPHFHVYIDKKLDFRRVAAKWNQIVGGDTDHLYAGTRVELMREKHGIGSYAGKYAAKAEQKEVPEGFENVGRFWGTFGAAKAEALHVYQAPARPVNGTLRELKEAAAASAGVYAAVRVARRFYAAWRKRKGLKKFRDNGLYSFRCYELGEVMREYLVRLGLGVPLPAAKFDKNLLYEKCLALEVPPVGV